MKTTSHIVDGIPAPNPSYKIPIKNVTGNSNLKIQNKNLFDVNGEITQIGLNTTIINNEINIPNAVGNPVSALLGYVKVEANKTYTIKFDLKQGKARVAFRLYDSNKQLINTNSISFTGMSYLALYEGYYKDGNSTTITIPSGYDISYIRPLTIAMNDTVTNIYANYQIEEGSTATSYAPHQEQNLPFTFAEGQRLMQGDVLEDTRIRHKRKRWVLTQDNINMVIGYSEAYGTKRVYIRKTDLGFKSDWNKEIALMNTYTEAKTNQEIASGKFTTINGANSFEIYDDRFTDLATARELLIGSIIEIEQAEDWFENYNSTQASQYEAIKNARSYADKTIISSTSDEESFDMKVTAYKEISKMKQFI